MKKIALSLFVIAASGAYVWGQSGQKSGGDLLGSALPPAPPETQGRVTKSMVALPGGAAPETGASSPTNAAAVEKVGAPPLPQAPPMGDRLPSAPPPSIAPAAVVLPIVNIPLPRLRPSNHPIRARVTRAAMTVVANGSYADGTYTGPTTDAYYGPMRIQAIVQGGRLVAIKVLAYPSDRRTSVAINRQALPMLRDEVIAAQSARVDIISGATLTSKAFIESLGAALGQAVPTSL